MNRRTRRRVVFPSIQFLREAAASQSQLFRLRRWILLALRSLAVLLIAAAFARPIWSASANPAATRSDRALVIVLDTSASVAQHPAGVAAIQRLRAAAQRLLTADPPAAADMIFAAALPRPAFGRLVPGVEALSDEVLRAQPLPQRADLIAAVRRAAEELADHTGPRQIVLLSDLQRTNWTELLTADLAASLAAQHIGFTAPAPPPGPAPVNLAVARPRVLPARPLAGRPARFLAAVTNHAAEPRTTDAVLNIDGRAAGSRRLLLQPGESREVSIDAALPAPGEHRITFTLPADDLDADNAAYLTVTAVQRVPILVIGDDDPQRPAGSSFYLLRALSPRGDGADGFDTRVLPAAQITDQALAGAEAVVIGDIGPLPAPAAQALGRYVAAGGGVLMFAGPGPLAANAAALQQAAGSDPLLPFTPGFLRELPPPAGVMQINAGAWAQPGLAAFDERSQDALAQIPFRRVYAAVNPSPTALTLLKFADGTPALSMQPHGRGKLMLASFEADPAGGDLVKHGTFVALLHSLVDDLRPARGLATAFTAGHPLSLSLPTTPTAADAPRIDATDPAGRPIPALPHLTGDRIDVQLGRAASPGFYTVRQNGQPALTLAVNLDERESDLRPLDTRQVDALLSPASDHGTAAAAAGRATDPADGVPLWPWLLLGAMAMMAAELAMLKWVKR